MVQQGHVFISPESCGSSVGYYITVDEYTPKDKPTKYSISSTVVLSDCNRKVDWSFGVGDIDKLDDAINMLKEFRKKFLDTEKMVAKLNKK